MTVHDLENRLRVMDLRLPEVGPHLDEERIALISGGLDPTHAEAAHLAGCDECTELLAALGEALEGLVVEAPELVERVLPPPPLTPPARRRAPWLLLLGGLCASAAAAATGAYLARASEPLAPAVEAGIESLAVPVPERTKKIVQELPPAPIPEPAVPATAAVESAAPATEAVSQVAPTRERLRSAPSSAVVPEAGPEAQLSARGPVAIERMAVDGPPRGFGFLRLGAKPAARVFIDGEFAGETPIYNRRLPEGPHDIRLIYDSDLAEAPEERFRVIIEPDQVWRETRTNYKRR